LRLFTGRASQTLRTRLIGALRTRRLVAFRWLSPRTRQSALRTRWCFLIGFIHWLCPRYILVIRPRRL